MTEFRIGNESVPFVEGGLSGHLDLIDPLAIKPEELAQLREWSTSNPQVSKFKQLFKQFGGEVSTEEKTYGSGKSIDVITEIFRPDGLVIQINASVYPNSHLDLRADHPEFETPSGEIVVFAGHPDGRRWTAEFYWVIHHEAEAMGPVIALLTYFYQTIPKGVPK